MEFDENKVRTKWSYELDGKKGWFSDFIDRENNGCLRAYVKSNDKDLYGICHKRGGLYPFKSENGTYWKYFYPEEDVMKFDKKNLFIAGYNDNLLHTGETGYTGDSVSDCVSKLTGCWTQNILTGCTKNGFITDDDIYQHQFFYRTKCAPETKYIPWTKETVPNDLLMKIVKSKNGLDWTVVIGIRKGRADPIATDAGYYSYSDFFDFYIMDDGTPCGQKVQNA